MVWACREALGDLNTCLQDQYGPNPCKATLDRRRYAWHLVSICALSREKRCMHLVATVDASLLVPAHAIHDSPLACSSSAEVMVELEQRWLAAGKPAKPDWERLLAGL